MALECTACSSESYDKAEAWCREVVSAGHEMLFSTQQFAAEMTRMSSQLGLSLQVCFTVVFAGIFLMSLQQCSNEDANGLLLTKPNNHSSPLSTRLETNATTAGFEFTPPQCTRQSHEAYHPISKITNNETCQIIPKWNLYSQLGKEEQLSTSHDVKNYC